MALSQVCNILIRENFRKALAAATALFVELQAVFDDSKNLLCAENTRQLASQPGVAPQFAAKLHPEAFAALGQRPGGTHGHTLPASQASIRVPLRPGSLRVRIDRFFLA